MIRVSLQQNVYCLISEWYVKQAHDLVHGPLICENIDNVERLKMQARWIISIIYNVGKKLKIWLNKPILQRRSKSDESMLTNRFRRGWINQVEMPTIIFHLTCCSACPEPVGIIKTMETYHIIIYILNIYWINRTFYVSNCINRVGMIHVHLFWEQK